MSKRINVLIVEDHPLIVDSYVNALKNIEKNNDFEFRVKTANDCDEGNFHIENSINGIPFDLVLLDIRLPPSKCGNILSGEDLGIKIKNLFNTVKIIIFTSYSDNYRINNLLNSINPEGFLIKEDTSYSDLVESIITVLSDPPYYSKSILKLIRQHVSNDFILDGIDRKLLYHLSIGSKMRDLPKVIPLSIAGIERRKRKLKDLFDAEDKKDAILIKKARDHGFI